MNKNVDKTLTYDEAFDKIYKEIRNSYFSDEHIEKEISLDGLEEKITKLIEDNVEQEEKQNLRSEIERRLQPRMRNMDIEFLKNNIVKTNYDEEKGSVQKDFFHLVETTAEKRADKWYNEVYWLNELNDQEKEQNKQKYARRIKDRIVEDVMDEMFDLDFYKALSNLENHYFGEETDDKQNTSVEPIELDDLKTNINKQIRTIKKRFKETFWIDLKEYEEKKVIEYGLDPKEDSCFDDMKKDLIDNMKYGLEKEIKQTKKERDELVNTTKNEQNELEDIVIDVLSNEKEKEKTR